MPISFLEVPVGIRPDAKQKLIQDMSDALYETFQVADTRIYFREYPAENVALDGKLQAEPMRPVCFLNVPPLEDMQAKRKLSAKLQTALAEAYGRIADTDKLVIFFHHTLPENAALGGRLFSDMRQTVEVGGR